MTPQDAADQFGQLLFDTGFDPERPNLGPFWAAFKAWVCLPVDCRADVVHIALGYDERRRFGYVELCRHFDHDREEWTFDLTARFYSTDADAPRIAVKNARSASQAGRAEALAAVEQLPEFAAAVEYPHWGFEACRE
jgi:hypothetical protein